MNKFDEIEELTIIKAIKESKYLCSILKSLGCYENSSNLKKLKEFITINNIDISHLLSKTNRKEYEQNPKRCKYCGNIIPYEKRQNKFCNSSCSASYNNIHKLDNEEPCYCLNCNKEIKRGNKYCDINCQWQYDYKEYIKRWKLGEESGMSGTDGMSDRVRRYMLEKCEYKCQNCRCDWKNPYTNLTILQIHHINGDSSDNSESNLQVLCPNCHAMTENFGFRNKNSSRIYRKRYRNS